MFASMVWLGATSKSDFIDYIEGISQLLLPSKFLKDTSILDRSSESYKSFCHYTIDTCGTINPEIELVIECMKYNNEEFCLTDHYEALVAGYVSSGQRNGVPVSVCINSNSFRLPPHLFILTD